MRLPRFTTRAQGAQAESLAARHLEANGLQVLERNFAVKGGEIDLICRDGSTIVFVEVRQRSRSDYGGAVASITRTKQQRLILAARHWLQRHGEQACRFDAVLIEGHEPPRIEWLQAAFSGD